MTQYVINTANIAPQNVQTAFNLTNQNFNQIFSAGPVGSNVQIKNNTILTTNVNGNLILAPNGIAAIVAASNIQPDIPYVRMIGSGANPFNTIYTQYIDAASASFSGNTFINGNLTVRGNTITANYSNLSIANLNITLANGSSNSATSNNAGILISGANASLLFNNTLSAWQSNIAIHAPSFSGDGGNLTNLTANTQAVNLLGNTLAASVLYSNLNTVGTLANLTLLGNISTAGTIHANIISGMVLVGNLSGDGSNIVNINANAIVGNFSNAVHINNALTANLAALATQAINADTALHAINADIANTANTATVAVTANTANYSVYADSANSAVVAGMAEQLSYVAVVSIQGNIITNSLLIGNGAIINGNITANNISVTGNIRAGYFYGDISNATGGYGNANVAEYLPTYSGNVNDLNFVGDAGIQGPASANGSAYLKLLAPSDTRLGNDAGNVEIWPAIPNQDPAIFSFGGDGNLTVPNSVYTNTIVGNSAIGQVVIIPNSAVSSDYWEFRTHPSGAPDGSITSALHVPPSEGANISAIHFSGYYGGGYLGWYNNNAWANSLTLISSNNVSITTEAQGGIPGETQWLFDTAGNLTLPALTGAVQSISLSSGGVGYTTANDVPTDSGAYGNGHGMTLNIVADTGNSNAVLSATINNPGQGYANGTVIQIAQPSSTGTATVTVATVSNGSPSINYANGQPYGGGGSVYANTVGSFGSDMGVGPNYDLNNPAVLFSNDDMVIRTGGTSVTGGVNSGQIDIAASEQLYIGLATDLADATYIPTGNYTSSIQFPYGGTNINVVVNGNTWSFDSLGNLTAPGNISANAITLKNTDDFAQIVFSNDGGVTNNGQIKVDGGTNMIVSAGSNFYVKQASQDRLAITNTTTDLMASTNVRIQSNKTATANTWTFVSDGTTKFPSYTFTNVDGTAGQVLSTDGNGTIAWANTVNTGNFLFDSTSLDGTEFDEIALTGTNSGNILINANGLAMLSAGYESSGMVADSANVYVFNGDPTFSNGIPQQGMSGGPGQVWQFDNTGTLNFPSQGNLSGPAIRVYDDNVSLGTNTGNVSIWPGSEEWIFGADGTLTAPGNIIGSAFLLTNAGNLTYSSIQQNQNPPFGSEAYGIEMLTVTTDANVYSSVTAGPDYVSLSSTNAGNANLVLQGGYGISFATSNATGGGVQTWTFEEAGVSLFPGAISTAGNVTADYFIGDGGLLSNIQVSGSNPVSTSGNVAGGNLITTGNISASGNIIGNSLLINGSGNILGNLNVQGNITFIGSNVIVTNDLYIDLANNQSTYANINGAGLQAGNTGTVPLTTWKYISSANAWATNVGVSATGNITSGNILTGGLISSAGNITGNYILGNGSQLTGISTVSTEPTFSIQSSNFSATAGNRYGVNTTSGAVTATLPTSPATGIAIFFADAGGAFATNNLIINPNGLTIMGTSGNMTVSTNNQSFGLFYSGTTWRTYNAG